LSLNIPGLETHLCPQEEVNVKKKPAEEATGDRKKSKPGEATGYCKKELENLKANKFPIDKHK
jgi:hypothetical protein